MPALRRLASAGLALACMNLLLDALLPAEARGRLRLALGAAAALAVLVALSARARGTVTTRSEHWTARATEHASEHATEHANEPATEHGTRPEVGGAVPAAGAVMAAASTMNGVVESPLEGVAPKDAAALEALPAAAVRRRAPTLAVLMARGADF